MANSQKQRRKKRRDREAEFYVDRRKWVNSASGFETSQSKPQTTRHSRRKNQVMPATNSGIVTR